MVTAENEVFTIQRHVRKVGGTHLDVSETIYIKKTAPVLQVAAVQVKHTAQFDQAGVVVTSVDLPGALYPYVCSTIENQDEVRTLNPIPHVFPPHYVAHFGGIYVHAHERSTLALVTPSTAAGCGCGLRIECTQRSTHTR